MEFEHVLVERSGEFATVTMNRPQRRNALSLAHMQELIAAFGELGDGDALGIVLAGAGPVFSSGHDFADMVEADLPAVRGLLRTCTELMTIMQQVPQPVVAKVPAHAPGEHPMFKAMAAGSTGVTESDDDEAAGDAGTEPTGEVDEQITPLAAAEPDPVA